MEIRGDRNKDTICALSTPYGRAGISIVRVSGPQAISIVQSIAEFIPAAPESHRVYYGIIDSIDEVLVTYFKAGKSFTGEDVLEISCHGNPQIVSSIIKKLISSGARAADRGEFTFRAFMNGRIDLTQAESVLQMIESQSELAAKQSLRQLQGAVSKELEQIENDIIWAMAHLEAGIDFSTEGLELVASDEMTRKIQSCLNQTQKLTNSFRTGRLLKEGLRVVIAGIPNVGKSSLLNAIIGEDKAIVTDTPGTTRDLVEAQTSSQGVHLQFVDTAGLRESGDKVEQIGIQKTKEALQKADAALFVYDVSVGLSENEQALLSTLNPKNTWIIGNKMDLSSTTAEEHLTYLQNRLKNPEFLVNLPLFLSAKDTEAVSKISWQLSQSFLGEGFEDQTLIVQGRQFEALSAAEQNLLQAKSLLETQSGSEFIALELKEALMRIQETQGKRFDDQIMDRVFKEFCIGK